MHELRRGIQPALFPATLLTPEAREENRAAGLSFAQRGSMTADEIRRLRLRKGGSRDQLAHALGVSYEKVAAWEDGERVDFARFNAVIAEGIPTPGSTP